MNIVKQKTKYDCALAVLSMASGKAYDEIFDKQFAQKIEKAKTCSDDDLIEAYKKAGFIKDQNMKVVYVGHNNVNVAQVRQMLWGRRAMIQVPSLNMEGSEHFIYWDGKEILDPSNLQTYKFLQHVFPTYVTFFDET